MTVTLRPVQVRVEAGEDAAEGRLAFHGNALVAVLVLLSGRDEEYAGHWFLEHGFGALGGPDHPIFPDLDAAEAWITDRLAAAARRGRVGA